VITLDPQPAVPIVSAGGAAYARAATAERMRWDGTGTFTPGAPRSVTGGGSFDIQGPQGQALSSGAFRATELVSWDAAPGTFAAFEDRIGNPGDRRTGLAVLRVAYSDGRQGVLVVSCRQADTPGPVFEGLVGTHGFETFYSHEFATGAPNFVNANRTLFHVLGPLGLPRTGDGTEGAEDDITEEAGNE
jgi:hypothetical protein